MQLFWGEPLDGIAERIDRLRSLGRSLGREHAPLQFGLRITTLVRDTTEEAWRDAEEKVARIELNVQSVPFMVIVSGPSATMASELALTRVLRAR